MAKLVLTELDSLESQTSALASLNLNFELIETAFENTLSRDGTTPNTLGAPLDYNNNRGINLGAPVNGTDAARLVDISNALSVDAVLIPTLVEDRILSNDGGTLVWRTPADIPGLGDVIASNNLSDLDSASAARTNLGLGSAAVSNTGTSGDAFGKLNTNNTYSGNNSFTGTSAFTGALSLGGTADHRLTGTPTALTDESLGLRSAPLNTRDEDYTLVLNDSGRTIFHTSASAHAWTVPPNSAVAYPTGTVIVLINVGSGVVTITRGSGVALRIAGTATDKNVAIAQHGVASMIKTATNSWYVSGAGIS